MGIQALLVLRYFYDCKTDHNLFECGKGARSLISEVLRLREGRK